MDRVNTALIKGIVDSSCSCYRIVYCILSAVRWIIPDITASVSIVSAWD